MRNLIIYIATILACVLMLKSVDAAVVWDGGSAVQTYKNGIKFGTNEVIKVDSSGDLKITDANSITRVIGEQGEKDLLLNRSFERSHSGSPALSWTLSGATGTVSASIPIDGNQVLSLSLSSTLSLSQEITATQYHPNVVSFSLWVKSSLTDLQLCSTLATVEQECVSYDGSDQWKKLQVLVTAPSSGAMGLKLKSLTSASGTVLVDAGEFSSNPLKFQEGVTTGSWDLNEIASNWNRTGSNVIYRNSSAPTFTKLGDTSALTFTNDGTDGFKVIATKKCLLIVATAISSSSGAGVNILKNGTTIKAGGGASYDGPKETPLSVEMEAGDYITWVTGSLDGARDMSFSFSTITKSPQIITANDVVSSDTINWSFKSTAITDCGGADAIGKYNTYTYAATTNTATISGTSPTQSDSVMAQEGFHIYARAGNATSTTASPSRVDVCIGKGLRAADVKIYKDTSKNIAGSVDYSQADGKLDAYGIAMASYNEKTGILQLDAGLVLYPASNTSHILQFADGTATNNGYLHFAASKNPVISALDAVPRVDFSWENEFSAKIQNNGTCSVLSENFDFIDSCNRSATGFGTVTFVAGHFTQAPSVVATTGTASDDTIAVGSVTTAGFSFETNTTAGAKIDRDFFIHVSRQGSDARSRGDAAAIISQPTCYVKDVKPASTPSGQFTGGIWVTRDLNSLSGDCWFLSLSGNQITLDAGTYSVIGSAPAHAVNGHKAKLFNVADSSDTIIGTPMYAFAANSVTNRSELLGKFNISSQKIFEVRHFCATTKSIDGFGAGYGVDGSVETYTQLAITKVK